jgi:hypothetical protein
VSVSAAGLSVIQICGLIFEFSTNHVKHPHFRCRFEDTKEPYRCCGQVACLSTTQRMTKLLDRDVLDIQLCHRWASGEDKTQKKPENYRYVAYRNIFFLLYGRTRPRMSRCPLPSCVVLKIRETYPDPNNHYTGFQAKKQKT